MFEMGFFSPGKSKNRYLAIWYKKISAGTVVWVANRETPINDTSGIFKVNRQGNLVILNGEDTMVWSSSSTVGMRRNGLVAVVVQLLDNGNLVAWDEYSTNKNLIWQSFDYPGDTFLQGMKFGKDLVTGLERYMTSWKSPDDPSPGIYNSLIDTNGYPQIFSRKGSVLIMRFGPWRGLVFSGFGVDIPNSVYKSEFVVSQKEIYYSYELVGPVIQRIVLTWNGRIQFLHWIERIQDWIVYAETGGDICARFELCGLYGSCSMNRHPPCSCMEGFEPIIPQEWEASDWSKGCQRKVPLNCGSEYGFKRVSGVKLPDTRKSWYNHSMTLGECDLACRNNCSCMAYANLDSRNGGSGCLIWFDELRDIAEFDDGDTIYIRMATTELAGTHTY
ncbi:G-type lectin S-receptor-like serine/threonine-protein kinase [Tanacetum coccineum]|uniref:G-type lectin S-receptor-like serine/threonine-protein kinase n=1 Tax=Tanacetum coccineum TaxID=301880 RepID=A0ABQ4YE72_9ASTR